MNKTFRIWFGFSRSDNRKSKACPEPRRRIQNRKLVGIVALVVTLAMCGARAEAQQPKKIPRIGFLAGGSLSADSLLIETFWQRMKGLGYIEGKNITAEYRFAEGALERLPNLAAELVRLNVDIIVAPGSGAVAAKKATNTNPIVITNGDPVGTGLVASLAHPGGNVTGLSSLSSNLGGKQLELLKEAFPKLSRVAILWDPTNVSNAMGLGETKGAAGALGITLQLRGVHGPNDFEPAFSAINREHTSAVIVVRSPITFAYQTRIVDFAAKSKLPAMYPDRAFIDTDGLMSYGPNFVDMSRRAAVYVDKILKGAKPAELPVEQPTKFEFVINLKTAKQIGLTIPQAVLYRADKVIR